MIYTTRNKYYKIIEKKLKSIQVETIADYYVEYKMNIR